VAVDRGPRGHEDRGASQVVALGEVDVDLDRRRDREGSGETRSLWPGGLVAPNGERRRGERQVEVDLASEPRGVGSPVDGVGEDHVAHIELGDKTLEARQDRSVGEDGLEEGGARRGGAARDAGQADVVAVDHRAARRLGRRVDGHEPVGEGNAEVLLPGQEQHCTGPGAHQPVGPVSRIAGLPTPTLLARLSQLCSDVLPCQPQDVDFLAGGRLGVFGP